MCALPRSRPGRCAPLLALLLAVALIPAPASAHEPRDILDSKVRVEAGFLSEPTVEGQINAVFFSAVSLTDKAADGEDKPIEGLEKTIKVEVAKGGGAQKRRC